MQRISEEYENYEPEVSVWPYVLLGFLVPLVPFLSYLLMAKHGFADSGTLIWNVLFMVPIALLFFASAYVVRTSEGSLSYIFIGVLHFFLTMFYWAGRSGDTAYPLGLMIAPSFLSPLAYAYYAKRKRKPAWTSVLILTALSSALIILYFALRKADGLYGLVCYSIPSLVLAISLFTFAVTRRMENTPWFIMIPLSLIAFFSLLMGDGFITASADIRELLIYILKEVASSYVFWYSVSIIITYQALSHKSYFRNIGQQPMTEEKSTEYKEDEEPRPFFPEGFKGNEKEPPFRTADYRTAYPPRKSRFEEQNKEDSGAEKPSDDEDESYEERPRRQRREYYDEPRPRSRRDYRDYDEDDYCERPLRRERYRDYDEYDDDYYMERRRQRPSDDDYYRERDQRERYDDRRRYLPRYEEDRPRRSVRDLDYEDDPRSQYDKWYDLIKGDNPDNDDRRR